MGKKKRSMFAGPWEDELKHMYGLNADPSPRHESLKTNSVNGARDRRAPHREANFNSRASGSAEFSGRARGAPSSQTGCI